MIGSHRSWKQVLIPFILLLPVITTSCGKTRPESEPIRDNVLLITLDTTRADRLGCYGYEKAKTPVLDRLADEGVLYEQAHAHVPLTLPSHATILSGKLPSTLSNRVNGIPVELGKDNLASFFSEQGYWTGAVVSAAVLDRHYGLATGFSVYEDRMLKESRLPENPNEKTAEQVTDSALSILSGVEGPYFMWVHYYDPHSLYMPPRPFMDIFRDDPYNGEIAFMDREIGRLMDGLKQSNRLNNTLIVIAGDHGEGLGDHGEGGHGILLYEYALRVPMILVWKDHLPEKVRRTKLCALTDIAPTILDLLNLKSWDSDGMSLKPFVNRDTLPDRNIYIETYHPFLSYGWAPLRGMMSDSLKYIDAPEPELYEWRTGESDNVYCKNHAFIQESKKQLEIIPALESEELKAMEDLKKDPSKEDARKQLMSLGYLTGGSADLPSNNLPDPKKMNRLAGDQVIFETVDMIKQGQVEAGLSKLKGLYRINPRSIRLISMLGLTHMETGRYDEAIEYFQKEIELDPGSETPHLNLGTVYKRTKQYDLAEKEYMRALELFPRYPEAVANLAWIYMETGRTDQARSLLERSIANQIESGDIYFEYGVLEMNESRLEGAYRAFTRSVKLAPRKYRAYYNLALMAQRLGKDQEVVQNLDQSFQAGQNDVDFLADLGNTFLKMKLKDRARACFQQALKLSPDSASARRYKRIISALGQVDAKNRIKKDVRDNR